MKTVSPINNYIAGWDGQSEYVDPIDNTDISIVYEEKIPSTTLLPVNNADIPDKRTRYQRGENVVFRCTFCNSNVGIGKTSDYKEVDKEKIVCNICNRVYEAKGYIRNSNNPLWQQPKEKIPEYNKAISEYIHKNQVKIVDL